MSWGGGQPVLVLVARELGGQGGLGAAAACRGWKSSLFLLSREAGWGGWGEGFGVGGGDLLTLKISSTRHKGYFQDLVTSQRADRCAPTFVSFLQ